MNMAEQNKNLRRLATEAKEGKEVMDVGDAKMPHLEDVDVPSDGDDDDDDSEDDAEYVKALMPPTLPVKSGVLAAIMPALEATFLIQPFNVEFSNTAKPSAFAYP